MGMFSFLDKPFRTGASKAARDAKAAGGVSLAEQGALKAEIGDIYQPRMDAGNQAFQDINSFYNGDQQTIIDQAQASPFMSSLVGAGENAIARNSQATGGFRSGTTQENLAQNEQSVLMGLVNQMLQGKQGIAQAGYGATDAYTTAMQNLVAGQGATRGQIANVDINKAAGKSSLLGGLFGAGASLGAAGISAGGMTDAAKITAASDIALKDNVVKVGTKHDLNWYTWDWNELANEIGLTGSEEGHIAQEVQKVRPDLVIKQNGYLAVNYEGF
ncbi:MAG: hypothetical protein Unbinned5350contig1004_2 [Prokaryotic dsDNA virus sp.]|nr:MAG: hypothetical protein Unbinned5350contig1004_2 [Prokaryotic dsDNA virus sp.]|tara:strand:+ start:18198 stop:19016 length:819 start_codon:yes stop_codon:yes gene_type:complete